MILLLTYFLFVLLLFVSFYIPGYLLLLVLKIKLPTVERHVLSFVIGTILFILLSYLFALIGIPQAIIFVLEVSLLLFVFRKYITLVKHKKHQEHPNFLTVILRDSTQWITSLKLKRQIFSNIDYWILSILILGSIVYTSKSFFLGLPTDTGMHFTGGSITHLASIKTQTPHFPLFYDFLLNRFHLLFGFTAEDLMFRLFPFYLALLFGGTILLLIRQLTQRTWVIRLLLFIGLLAVFILPAKVDVTVSAYDQRLYSYFAQQVDRDELIVYLPQNTWHNYPIIAAMTGRNVYLETPQLKKALMRCNENEIRRILKEIGSNYILTEKKNQCLASDKIRGTKIASKTLQFYILEDR